MEYHFKIHKEKNGFWGECVELEGCTSQGSTLEELKINLKEALDLYLDEPYDSKVIFPLPKKRLLMRNLIKVNVDPQIALAFMLRLERLKRNLTQAETASQMGVPLYSYQKLEKSKTANPEWKTLIRLRQIFPSLDLNLAV